jgi:O-acetyl-ADP-ribose deacetylase (regulator of RNase III)
MVVHVAKGSVAQLPVDAVVTPSSIPGVMVGTSAHELRERGGPALEEEARALAPIAVGAAIVTGPGQLYCRHVIHVPVVEEPGEKIGIENARRATRAALIAAQVHGFETIGIPSIGAQAGGLAYDEAARAIVDEVRGHRGPKPATVYLIDPEDYMLRAFEDALRMAQ